MLSIFSLTIEELGLLLEANNIKKFKSKQIFKWVYDKRVNDFDKMTDLSKDNISFLKNTFIFDKLIVKKKQVSSDGTVKFLFEINKNEYVESVLMKFNYGYSACISTQLGCNMGCKFCASGLLKKQRNLEVNEIVLQVIMIYDYLLKKEGIRLSNIVVMGTGEPFDNYDNVIKALSIINSPYGINIGSRHISISTCGIVDKIIEFANAHYQYNLAISLHAANDELRTKIMPVNNKYNLRSLIDSLKYYSKENNRRITFEYILLDGVNNSKKDAKDISKLIKGLSAYVNLIPYNEVKENSYKSVSDENALIFYDMLKKEGVNVTLRQKRGVNIDAACGQLRAKELKK